MRLSSLHSFGFGLALLMSTTALAAPVGIEEFGAMTRITIPAAAVRGWAVTKGEGRIDLKTVGTDIDIDPQPLSQSSRLKDLEIWKGRTDSGVSLRYTCDCEANYYSGEGGIIVVDIADRSPGAVASRTLWQDDTVVNQGWGSARIVVPTQTPAPVPATAAIPTPRVPDRRAESDRLANVLVATPVPKRRPRDLSRPRASANTARSTDAGVDALRDTVLSQLALAVEQGRVTIDTDIGRGNADYVRAGCPDEDALDLKRLSGSNEFRTALPTLRTNVFDDLKQVNPSAVRMLARHFIAFGLGAEARNVISAFGTEGAPETLILSMSTILEGDSAKADDSLLLKPDCGPRASVWRAAVAAERETGSVHEIYDEAGSALLNLPGPLRQILGARIALGLIDENEREDAMRLWRNLETASGPGSPELELLSAYAVEGRALQNLLALSETRSPAALEAAERAARILLAGDDAAAAERLGTTLEDMVFIHANTPREGPLSLAYAKLQARYGDLASALSVLAEKIKKQPERAAHWRVVTHETIRSATEGSDPVSRPRDFDTILSSVSLLDNSPASDNARFSLTRKLIDAGGTHLVDRVLTPKVVKRSDEAQRLMAETKLLMGDAAGARALLRNLKDETSMELKDRALKMSGSTARDAANALFDPVKSPSGAPSISAARRLVKDTEADLAIVEELLADG